MEIRRSLYTSAKWWMGIPLAVGITARTNIQQKKLLREKEKVCSVFWFGLDPSAVIVIVISHSYQATVLCTLGGFAEHWWGWLVKFRNLWLICALLRVLLFFFFYLFFYFLFWFILYNGRGGPFSTHISVYASVSLPSPRKALRVIQELRCAAI